MSNHSLSLGFLALVALPSLNPPLSAQGGSGGGGSPAPQHLLALEVPGVTFGPMVKMTLDGASVQKIITRPCTPPSWFPQGDKIVFGGRDPQGNHFLYTALPNGNGITPLVATGWNLSSQTRVSPVPSLNGKHMICMHAGVGPVGLYLVAVDGTGFQLLYDQEDTQYACWSPDARSVCALVGSTLKRIDLALAANGQFVVSGFTDLFVGTPLEGRHGGTGTDMSSDGQRIAVTVHQGDDSDVWVVPVANPALAYNLTNTPTILETEPCFGPADGHIYYSARPTSGGRWGIWRRPTTGGAATAILTSSKKNYRSPAALR